MNGTLMPTSRPRSASGGIVPDSGPQVEVSLQAPDWFKFAGLSRAVIAGEHYRVSPCRWSFRDVQSVIAWSLPLYAVGTSTAHVGLLESECVRSAVSDASVRATAVELVSDLRSALGGTSFVELTYDNLSGNPFRGTATRMGELRTLAPDLSLREWAEAFGVTKQTISNWVVSEPRERPELDAAVVALRGAAVRHPGLSAWLRASLPSSDRSPLDLVRDRRWRALRAATRLKAPIATETQASARMREAVRARRALSKRLGGADAPPAEVDEA